MFPFPFLVSFTSELESRVPGDCSRTVLHLSKTLLILLVALEMELGQEPLILLALQALKKFFKQFRSEEIILAL